jgi:hypothetical protein
MIGAGVGVALLLFHPSTAAAAPTDGCPESTGHLGIEVGADGVVSGSGAGAVGALGFRFLARPQLAATLDIGFGLEGTGPSAEDRWWTIPSLAWVVPIGPATLDVGGGLGIGTVSGYGSASAFFSAPFAPHWHFTTPTARAYLTLSLPVSARLDLFARAEVGSLLTSASSADATWEGLALGVRFRVL